MASESSNKPDSIFSIESKDGEKKVEIGLHNATTTRVFKDGRARDSKGRFGADKALEVLGEPKWEKQWTLKIFGYEIGEIGLSLSRKGISASVATAKAEVEIFQEAYGKSLNDVAKAANNDTIHKINGKLAELGFDTSKLTIKQIIFEGPGAEMGGSIGTSIEKLGASASAQVAAVKVTLNFEHSGGNSEISFKLAGGVGAGKSVVRAKKDPTKLGAKNEQVIKIASLEIGFKGDLPKTLLDKLPAPLRSALESEQQTLLEDKSSSKTQDLSTHSSSNAPNLPSSNLPGSSTVVPSQPTESFVPSARMSESGSAFASQTFRDSLMRSAQPVETQSTVHPTTSVVEPKKQAQSKPSQPVESGASWSRQREDSSVSQTSATQPSERFPSRSLPAQPIESGPPSSSHHQADSGLSRSHPTQPLESGTQQQSENNDQHTINADSGDIQPSTRQEENALIEQIQFHPLDH